MNNEQQLRIAHWAELFKEQKESGLTVNEWIADRGISRNTFYYWKKRFKKLYINSILDSEAQLPQSINQSSAAPAEHHEFVALPAYEPISESESSTMAAVLVKGELHVELYNNASPQIVKGILEAMCHA